MPDFFVIPALAWWPGARFTNDFFARNLNLMEISPSCNSVAGHTIETNFCTCHDSTAVVPCTKFCSDRYVRIVVTVKRNCHRIWISMEKPLVKWGPATVDISRHTDDPNSFYLLLTFDGFIWLFCVIKMRWQLDLFIACHAWQATGLDA